MRKLAPSLYAAALVMFLAIGVTAQADWKGEYYFGEDGGKNAGGVTIFVEHRLSVFDGGQGLVATLESNGYQTSSNLVCSVTLNGTKLLVYFESYGEENMFEPYNAGDLLLTLEQKTEKGKTIVLTHWGKFTPSILKNAKPGKVYFEKEKPH